MVQLKCQMVYVREKIIIKLAVVQVAQLRLLVECVRAKEVRLLLNGIMVKMLENLIMIEAVIQVQVKFHVLEQLLAENLYIHV